jgi:hypothetical protein
MRSSVFGSPAVFRCAADVGAENLGEGDSDTPINLAEFQL